MRSTSLQFGNITARPHISVPPPVPHGLCRVSLPRGGSVRDRRHVAAVIGGAGAARRRVNDHGSAARPRRGRRWSYINPRLDEIAMVTGGLNIACSLRLLEAVEVLRIRHFVIAQGLRDPPTRC